MRPALDLGCVTCLALVLGLTLIVVALFGIGIAGLSIVLGPAHH